MRVAAVGLVGVLFTAACGSGTTCKFPDVAVFSMHYTEHIGGTCGAIPDTVQATGTEPDPAVMCTGDSDWVSSDNGCSRTRTEFCTAGSVAQQESASIAFAGGDDWVGTVTINKTAPKGCHSVYDVLLVRQ